MAQCFFLIGASKPTPVTSGSRSPVTSSSVHPVDGIAAIAHEKGTNPITRRSRSKQLPILGMILQVLMKRYFSSDFPNWMCRVFSGSHGVSPYLETEGSTVSPTCFIESSGFPAKSNAKVRLDIRTGWWFGTWLLFSISYMGCHPNPIDELIFFNMVKVKTNHQPDMFELILFVYP